MKKHFAFTVFLLFFAFGNTVAQADLHSRIRLLIQTSRPTEVLAIVDSIDQTGKHRSETIFQYYRASCYLSLNKAEESRQICSDVIARGNHQDTVLPKVYFLRSFSYERDGKHDLAIQDLEKAIQFRPGEVSYYINASYNYGELGQFENSLIKLRKAIQLAPNNASVYNNLSYYSGMNREFQRAIDYANEGMKFAKSNFDIALLLNNRGYGKYGLRKYEDALVDINDAIRLMSENTYAYFNKALVYIELGNLEIACENLQLSMLYGKLSMAETLIGKICN